MLYTSHFVQVILYMELIDKLLRSCKEYSDSISSTKSTNTSIYTLHSVLVVQRYIEVSLFKKKEICHSIDYRIHFFLLYREECSSKGGSSEGSCASGFGVCCISKLNKIHKLYYVYFCKVDQIQRCQTILR